MRKDFDVHETWDLYFNRFRVPESLISDGAKAHTGGKPKAKDREAGCYSKLTDPDSPWQIGRSPRFGKLWPRDESNQDTTEIAG
jgi:hypothetical protein